MRSSLIVSEVEAVLPIHGDFLQSDDLLLVPADKIAVVISFVCTLTFKCLLMQTNAFAVIEFKLQTCVRNEDVSQLKF